jgi:hypothetical protein
VEREKPHRIHGRSEELWNALRDAGVIRDGDYVRRVIIDIDVNAAVVVYIERYGDTRLLDLIPVLGGAEIRGVPETGDKAMDGEGELPCGS